MAKPSRPKPPVMVRDPIRSTTLSTTDTSMGGDVTMMRRRRLGMWLRLFSFSRNPLRRCSDRMVAL